MNLYVIDITGGPIVSYCNVLDLTNALWIALSYSTGTLVSCSVIAYIKDIVLSGETWTDEKGIMSVYKKYVE